MYVYIYVYMHTKRPKWYVFVISNNLSKSICHHCQPAIAKQKKDPAATKSLD